MAFLWEISSVLPTGTFPSPYLPSPACSSRLSTKSRPGEHPTCQQETLPQRFRPCPFVFRTPKKVSAQQRSIATIGVPQTPDLT